MLALNSKGDSTKNPTPFGLCFWEMIFSHQPRDTCTASQSFSVVVLWSLAQSLSAQLTGASFPSEFFSDQALLGREHGVVLNRFCGELVMPDASW